MAKISVSSESFSDQLKSQRNRAFDRLALIEASLDIRDRELAAVRKIAAEQEAQLRAAATRIGSLEGELAVFKNPPQDQTGS